jgi:SNF2 family DNA or RNA helicase
MNRYKTQPYDHQAECRRKFQRPEAYALLADMGTGKTWIIIQDIADLWASDDCAAVLVLAPNGVHSNWTRIELGKHMPDWVKYKAVTWVAQANKAERKELDEMYHLDDGQLLILAMNHEAIQTKRGFEFAKAFCETSRKLMIVLDEADAFKNPTANRTEALMRLKTFSSYRRIMTGTLINNAPFDAYAPFAFLDETILGTTSFYAFKAEYAEMLQPGNPLLEHIKAKSNSNRTPQIVAKGPGGRKKYRNLDKLSALMAPHSFRVLKSECLDLPEKIYKTLIFSMTKQQISVYLKAEKECRLVFENEETPFNKLNSVTKLAQITSGYYLHPAADEPVRIEGKNPKMELLEGRVKKITGEGNKVIIWARYRIEISDIAKMCLENKIKIVQYHGGVKKNDRIEAIKSFEGGDAQVFIGQQQAGGTGITLVAASYVIYFSNDFSLRNRLQSEDRAHRIGQTKNVVYINLAGKGTVDEHVIRALLAKQDVADTIINKGLKLFGEAK